MADHMLILKVISPQGVTRYIWRRSGAHAAAGRHAAHHRRELALGSLTTLGREGVIDGSELGMLGALLDLDRRGHLPRGLTAVIDPLLDYDAARGTDLAHTAFDYLETDGNIARTSQLLHVHRNTIRQRLERITTLLGAGWDASPRRLEIHLALRVRQARGDLG
jgi:DNA-binding PucR family transcriptional regulator